MPMVERGDQPRLFGQQHAIAEDIARHVAHADTGERVELNIPAHFAEMALDGFPGAFRGDAHLLVVVAMAAAGGEGIAEPEAARSAISLAMSEKVAVPLSAATTK